MLRLGDVVAREGRLTEEAIDGGGRHGPAVQDDRRGAAGRRDRRDGHRRPARGCQRAGSSRAHRSRDGVAVKVVSGIREAQLIFEAVRASVLIDPGPALCADLGGGSLELSVGDRFGLTYATSLHLGVGRLTAEYVRTIRPSKKDRARLRERIEQSLDEVLPDVLACGPKLLIGTSGTFCALVRGAAAMRRRYRPVLGQSTHRDRPRARGLGRAHLRAAELRAGAAARHRSQACRAASRRRRRD